MDGLNPPQSDDTSQDLVKEFEVQSKSLDLRLDNLKSMIEDLRTELQGNSKLSLGKLAQVARDMAAGQVYQKIDLEAKGEIGALVSSLNQTLLNLQQLDASVKAQSHQVPELAAQLDAITSDTERATQDVMNRLDGLMAHTEDASDGLRKLAPAFRRHEEQRAEMAKSVASFLDRAAAGEDSTHLAGEILEYLFALQMEQAPPLELEATIGQMQAINDEAFEILNILQFQDITRQKIEKVVMLLKNFQSGLQRLLVIFNIEAASGGEDAIFDHRKVATQDNIFKTTMEADQGKDSVDDIIAQFKKKQS